MPVLSAQQARVYASQAGFSGNAVNIIVAIARAESSLNTAAQHINADGSVDRGILQINGRWHPEISDSCAYDAACAFRAGYSLSQNGTNFSAWATYTGGQYLHFLDSSSIPGAIASHGNGSSAMPWYQYPITHGYLPDYDPNSPDTPHFAIDLATPMDTPLSFLESGTIKKADYQAWGGEVFLQPDKGGPEEYHYHLDRIDVHVGQHVQAGETIGLSGGQTSGGQHPTDPSQSTGPHDHFGLFTEYRDTEIGVRPYGPDPTRLVQAGLASSSSGDTTRTAVSGAFNSISHATNQVLGNLPGFGGLAVVLDLAEQFPGIKNHLPDSSVQVVPGGPNDPINQIASGINALGNVVLDPQDYIGGAFLSVIDTVWSNFLPLAFRSVMVLVGLMLVFGLVWKAIDGTGLIQDAAKVAA